MMRLYFSPLVTSQKFHTASSGQYRIVSLIFFHLYSRLLHIDDAAYRARQVYFVGYA